MSERSYTKYLGVVLDDRYEILEKIGEGGMAIVYRAMDTRLNREVAVKIVRDELFGDEEISSRFFAEAHAVAKLSHPGIVAVYDVSQTEDVSYLVMELISGITLRQYMERKHPVPWKQVLHFSRQIADALQHAHERGIIHRDIKPQNIMLLPNGAIKVADFGIAEKRILHGFSHGHLLRRCGRLGGLRKGTERDQRTGTWLPALYCP